LLTFSRHDALPLSVGRADAALRGPSHRIARLALAARSADPPSRAHPDGLARDRHRGRAQPPGPAHDGRGRPADPAARSRAHRPLDTRGPRPGTMETPAKGRIAFLTGPLAILGRRTDWRHRRNHAAMGAGSGRL